MRNTVKFGMVSADKIMLSSTGIGLLDVHETIKEGLSQEDLELYTRAINKVSQGVKLNRKDLKVLDRIDQLTMDVHGICLKDSKMLMWPHEQPLCQDLHQPAEQFLVHR